MANGLVGSGFGWQRVLKIVLSAAVLLAAVIAGAVVFGARRWDSETAALRARLEAARVAVRPLRVDFRELPGLPAPVQRFFRNALTEGRPLISAARLRHGGTFNTGEDADNWRAFTSEQRVVTRRPGFDWDGRIEMIPGLIVRVHDAYLAGEGLLHASLLGLFPLADVRGTAAVAEGELMRFLAEAAWYPTALLPSQGVRWQAADGRAALATLTDGGVTVALLFSFSEAGLIESVRAEARGRMVKGQIVPTPWEGRFWNYVQRDGMRIPLDGEVAWLLPTGARPYWRGRLREIAYEFAQ